MLMQYQGHGHQLTIAHIPIPKLLLQIILSVELKKAGFLSSIYAIKMLLLHTKSSLKVTKHAEE